MPDSIPKDLNLWKNRLGHVPEWVWEQTNLETLVLADNDLASISERIGGLKRLRMLDLGHNVLTAVPETLADLDGLSDFLYLHDNRLSSLPPSLNRLKRLRYLNISENAFEVLPECISGIANLIELRASDNPLASVPDSLQRLTNLRELHLRNTKLESLPESIGGLHELRQIDLRGNPLKYLPVPDGVARDAASLDRALGTRSRPVASTDPKQACAGKRRCGHHFGTTRFTPGGGRSRPARDSACPQEGLWGTADYRLCASRRPRHG
jgi:hypothetical protein